MYSNKKLISEGITISAIVSGGARGADALAEIYARENRIRMIIHKPRLDLYGKSAAYYRNIKIVDDCDIMIALWDGESPGTKMTVNLATCMKKRTIILTI